MSDISILAIDTAHRFCSVALICAGEILQLQATQQSKRSQNILELINNILPKQKFKDLSALAFAAGPGSLTGLKIGSSIIQAFNLVYNKPIIKISTLAALALQAHDQFGAELVMPCIDAKMGQVYYGLYEFKNNNLQKLQADSVAAYSEVIFPDSNFLLVGDGAKLLADHYIGKISDNISMNLDLISSSAKYIATIAEQEYVNYGRINHDPIPWYLRLYE